jgi:hypothetical protein
VRANLNLKCISLKTILTYVINITLYGIILPILVYGLASVATVISCRYYWGEEFMQGDSGFKLGAWITFYFVTLTLYYYLFAFISFGFDHRLRRVSVAITITMPILFHYLISGYDYRITISFTGFHLTYYALFYGFVWLQQLIKNSIITYFKEKQSTKSSKIA